MLFHLLREFVTSNPVGHAPSIRKQRYLYLSGFCDSISTLTSAICSAGLRHVYVLGQYPVVTHGLVLALDNSDPLRVLSFMLGLVGLVLCCMGESLFHSSLLIAATACDTVSLLSKSRYIAHLTESADIKRVNVTVGATSLILTTAILLLIRWVHSVSASESPSGSLDPLSWPHIWLASCWGVISSMSVYVARSAKQSPFTPLLSFLVCSISLLVYSESYPRTVTEICGQTALLVSVIIQCITQPINYRETSAEMQLLTRTTE